MNPVSWPSWPTKDDRPSGLSLAFAGQFGALVLPVLLVLPFVEDGEIQGGALGIVASLIPFWAVLIGAVVLAARRRNEGVRELVGGLLQPRDALFVLVGVALQFGVALVYLPFDIGDDDLGKPARALVEDLDRLDYRFVILGVALAVGAPVVEELFYRGLLTRAITRVLGRSPRTNAVLGVVLSAAWFGAVHFQPLQFPALFIVGLATGVLTLRSGRIGPALFLHVGFNLTTVLLLANEVSQN